MNMTSKLEAMLAVGERLETAGEKIIAAHASRHSDSALIQLLGPPQTLAPEHVLNHSLDLERHMLNIDGVEVFWFVDAKVAA